jgi:hypothetical protein
MKKVADKRKLRVVVAKRPSPGHAGHWRDICPGGSRSGRTEEERMRPVSVTALSRPRDAMRARARGEVAAACGGCGAEIVAQRSTKRYCGATCRQRAYRAERPLTRPVAHQRRIREREAARDPRPIMTTLEGCTVAPISFAAAKALITRYEWLGTMPTGPRAAYGLKDAAGGLIGVAVFDRGPAPESGDICGRDNRDKAICLARGACVHWAHPHAASFLIARACKLARQQFGWAVFYAYSDPQAGELGTIYQAANGLYLGAGTGRNEGRGRPRFFNRREGRWVSERVLRKRGLKPADLGRDHWIIDATRDKGRYAFFVGSRREKRDLLVALKYPPLAYPKRGRVGGQRRPDAVKVQQIAAS